MVEEKKYEKKVEVMEKPLGGTKRVEETEQQVSEQPSAAAQPGRAENVASKSGESIGRGLKKVASVVGEFAAGVSKEVKPGETPTQGEQQAQQTEQRSEQTERTQEAPQGKVVEKEKTEKKVVEDKE